MTYGVRMKLGRDVECAGFGRRYVSVSVVFNHCLIQIIRQICTAMRSSSDEEPSLIEPARGRRRSA